MNERLPDISKLLAEVLRDYSTATVNFGMNGNDNSFFKAEALVPKDPRVKPYVKLGAQKIEVAEVRAVKQTSPYSLGGVKTPNKIIFPPQR